MASENTGDAVAQTQDTFDYVSHKMYVDITKVQIMCGALRVVKKEARRHRGLQE